MPCRPFRCPIRSRHHPLLLGRAHDCLAARSLAFRRFLLGTRSHTRGFQSPGCRPGTGYHPGPSTASRISVALYDLGHVAKPDCYGRSYADTRLPSGKAQFPRARMPEISGGRSQKAPLTHSAEFFAVRHRLPNHLLASPSPRQVGPFTVELFTFGGFYDARMAQPIPGFRHRTRPAVSPRSGLPARARLSELALRQARTPWAGLGLLIARRDHPLRNNTAADRFT